MRRFSPSPFAVYLGCLAAVALLAIIGWIGPAALIAWAVRGR